MRWRSALNFVVALLFTFAYAWVAILNFIGAFHAPLIDARGPVFHPILCMSYFGVALIITWTLYFYPGFKSRRFSFFILIIVGIALLFSGVFLWRIADKVTGATAPITQPAQQPIQGP